jgi:hypothetical protein
MNTSDPKIRSRRALARQINELSVERGGGGLSTAGRADVDSGVVRLANEDYAKALRRCLSRWELRDIIKEGKGAVWPDLNRRSMALVSPQEFVRRWSAIGVDFKLARLSGKTGLALLGFYVRKTGRRGARPIIFVNTAHHPAIIGAALAHEMGHHLTARLFDSSEASAPLFSSTGFLEHLTDPAELAADTLVSLASMPASVARARSATTKQVGDAQGNDDLHDPAPAQLFEYLVERYGLRGNMIGGSEKKVQTFAAVVHYTKLRRALWDVYET